MDEEFDIEKLKLEIKTIEKIIDSLGYLIPIFEHDLVQVEHQLDQSSNQRK